MQGPFDSVNFIVDCEIYPLMLALERLAEPDAFWKFIAVLRNSLYIPEPGI